MTPKEKKRVPGDKPFPWRCPKCLERAVNLATIQYKAKAAYEGRVYEFDVSDLTIPKCEACGELVFGYKEGDQITQALGAHLRLLSHTEIRESRKRLGLSQKELAERLGPAEATISHWESGTRLQSRAMDNLLRVFFEIAAVREALGGSRGSQTQEPPGWDLPRQNNETEMQVCFRGRHGTEAGSTEFKLCHLN